MKSIVIVESGMPGPDAPKYKAVAEMTKYKQGVKLPGDGPYDLWWQPKNGLAIRVVAGLKLKDGIVNQFRIDDYLGVVSVRGDDLPRAAKLTIAAQDDPGPGEKGHVAVQSANDYRTEMAVPDGYYSLWLTPDNGSRPRKINDRFRVQAGKTVQLD